MLVVSYTSPKSGGQVWVEGETVAECLDLILQELEISWEVISDTEGEQAPKPEDIA